MSSSRITAHPRNRRAPRPNHPDCIRRDRARFENPQDVIATIPSGFGFHDARKAEECADRSWRFGSEQLNKYMLKIGYKTIISAGHTRSRKAQKTASSNSTKGIVVDFKQTMIAQFGYPIVAPGEEARDLIYSYHEHIGMALAEAQRQQDGIEATVAILRHLYEVTAQFPGRVIHELLSEGLLTEEDLLAWQYRRVAA